MFRFQISWLFAVSLAAILGSSSLVYAELRVTPAAVVLDSPESRQLLLVSHESVAGVLDLTRRARYSVADSRVVAVDRTGLVEPLSEGRTEIFVTADEERQVVLVEVTGLLAPRPVSFQNEVMPILTKAGCNSGECHGKTEGQNGFQLSVFGFDPEADHEAIVQHGRGRRVFPAAPARSMLLMKAAARVPHGGGQKIETDSLAYRRLRRWISEGTRYDRDAPTLQAITVGPAQRILAADGAQQLEVAAIDANGHRRCVTVEAEYQSNAAVIAEVDQRGLVQASGIPGEAAILVRYMGQVAVCRITVPRDGVKFARPTEQTLSTGSSGTSSSSWESNLVALPMTRRSSAEYFKIPSARFRHRSRRAGFLPITTRTIAPS